MKKEILKIPNDDKKWIESIKEKLSSKNISEKEKAYLERIIRVYNMKDLSKEDNHPVKNIIEKVISSEYYEGFTHLKIPEIVAEYETFDLFNFSEDHIARRPSDSYFIKKSENHKESLLLRPHTSVMWYHYIIKGGGLENLEKTGEIKALSWGKVYRVDEFDKTHHECFHQIDGLKVCEKSKEIINKKTLKEVLINTIKAIFGENIKYRFNEDFFPYTVESLEVEVEYEGKWLEVLGAGVVNPTVLEKLGIESQKYNGWAFGFGIERLAMILKKVPDIRIFWSEDKRIKDQWLVDDKPYKEISNFPPVYKDLSFLVPKNKFELDKKEMKKSGEIELTNEADNFDIAGIIRNIAGNLIEEVKITDIYENDEKFGKNKKSVTLKIIFRSLERTLTNEEINKMYFEIREKIEKELNYILR